VGGELVGFGNWGWLRFVRVYGCVLEPPGPRGVFRHCLHFTIHASEGLVRGIERASSRTLEFCVEAVDWVGDEIRRRGEKNGNGRLLVKKGMF